MNTIPLLYQWHAILLQGKWMYEVILGTCGIQQIGWATLQCPFTSEEGVGDAPDSYAWDGKRVQRWNVSPHPYGTPWAPGDVIGVCADMESGQLSFVKNGTDMGGGHSTTVSGAELCAGLSGFQAVSASPPPKQSSAQVPAVAHSGLLQHPQLPARHGLLPRAVHFARRTQRAKLRQPALPLCSGGVPAHPGDALVHLLTHPARFGAPQ